MALLLRRTFQAYQYAMTELRDPRADRFYFLSSPWPVLILCWLYLKFVLDWGPVFMKNRKPYNIDKLIRVYDLFQVVANAAIFILATGPVSKMNPFCAPIDYGENPSAMLLHTLSYYYHLNKISDLLDTVFFVLRKKSSNVSFLHVYHHAGMVFVSWVGVKFIAGGQTVYVGVLNTAVHTVMYFYYFISSYNKDLKNNVWWKKYITQMQIAQFFILLVMFGGVALQPNCQYPKPLILILFPQNLLFLLMFSDFYVRVYLKGKNSKATTSSGNSIGSGTGTSASGSTSANNSTIASTTANGNGVQAKQEKRGEKKEAFVRLVNAHGSKEESKRQ